MQAHHHSPFPVNISLPQKRKVHVYIGLDFGTTYTKISYSISGTVENKVKTVAFGSGDNQYFHDSVAWLTPDGTLLFSQPYGATGVECLRYFKYSMVLPGLSGNKSHEDLKAVSTFFLGCMLTLIRQQILEAERLEPSLVEWHVNLGIPAGTTSLPHQTDNEIRFFAPRISDKAMHALFLHVLNSAYQFSMSDAAASGSIRLSEMKAFVRESLNKPYSSNLNCIPELFAEVLLYYQDPNIPDGLYCVCDVGGGTVDMAVFMKEIGGNRGSTVECLAHAVAPIGFEKLVETASGNSVSPEVRKHLASLRLEYPILTHNKQFPNRDGIHGKCLTCLVHRFEAICGRYCIDAVRSNRPTTVRRQVAKEHTMSLFLLGGGSSVKFYDDIISYMCNANQAAGFPFKDNANILDHLKNYDRFIVKDNSRIIISQMLAQPYDLIPKLNGSRWELDKNTWSTSNLAYGQLQPDDEGRNSDATPKAVEVETLCVQTESSKSSTLQGPQICPNGWSCTELEINTRAVRPPHQSAQFRNQGIAVNPKAKQTRIEHDQPIAQLNEYCTCQQCHRRVKKSDMNRHLRTECVVAIRAKERIRRRIEHSPQTNQSNGYCICPKCNCRVKITNLRRHQRNGCRKNQIRENKLKSKSKFRNDIGIKATMGNSVIAVYHR